MVTLVAAPSADQEVSGRFEVAAATVLSVGFAVVYTVFSVGRHRAFITGAWDLGVFEQAVRSYAEGRWPVSEIRDPDMVLYGDHFSPILAVLAPAYKLWPTPVTLLVAQTLLFALSVFPITRVAFSMVGRGLGVVVGLCYGLSWGLQEALGFDFHEIAFAVPLLAFALEAFLRGQPVRAVAFAAPLVLVKEDLGMTVAVLGLLIARRPGNRRLGLWTAAAGAAASVVTVVWIIPSFASDGRYRYLGAGGIDAPGGGLLDSGKLHLLLLLLAPTLFLALRSPLLLLALPTLAWRLGGTNDLYWLPGFHYDAVLMPILFAALIHGLVLVKAIRFPALVATVLIAACLLISRDFHFRDMADPGFGNPPAWAPSAYALMNQIPDGATVATENELAPRLTSRTTVHALSAAYEVEWILIRTDRENAAERAERAAHLDELTARGAHITTDGALILLRR